MEYVVCDITNDLGLLSYSVDLRFSAGYSANSEKIIKIFHMSMKPRVSSSAT